MTDDKITVEEIRAMFGDQIPLDAFRILFPELLRGGIADTRKVSSVRSDLVACALRYRDAPLELSKENQAERLAMVHVLQSCGLRRPINRDSLIEITEALLGMPKALDVWLSMADEALDIMRDARVRMSKRLENN